MANSTYVDMTRFGSGGEGTSFLTVAIEIPLSGVVQIGVGWNKDQFAVYGTAGVNLVIPALQRVFERGITVGDVALSPRSPHKNGSL